MKLTAAKTLLALLFIVTISGCASTSAYQVNPAVPKASIQNTIDTTYSRHDSISIQVYEGKQPFNLFYINNNRVSPENAISIEANKPLKFAYRQSLSGGDSCSVDVRATLEPNKQYAFIGGTKFEKGLIPFLPDRGCEFGIKDLATGNLISN